MSNEFNHTPNGDQARCELTVLMPCLDEARTLATCIEKAKGYIASRGLDAEILIADNGSSDGSQDIARNAGARVVDVPARGYGAALIGGIAAARGRYVIMGDADDSYDFSSLDGFVERLRDGEDLVMGNRFKGGIEPGAMPPSHKYLGNPVLSAIGRIFFRAEIGDFHCGLRGFNRAAIQGLGLSTTGMEFASEMVVKAHLNGLKVTEVPTRLSRDGRDRPPHLRSWRDGWRHLRFLLLFSPRWLFFYPGILLSLLGLLGMLWLVGGPRAIGRLVLDVNSLVYCAAALICGCQAVLFAVFAKLYAINAGLVRSKPFFRRAIDAVSMELGLVTGLILVIGGLAATVLAVSDWRHASFGDLDPSQTLRIVVPAATTLILGLQVILGSFFLGVLNLQTNGHGRPANDPGAASRDGDTQDATADRPGQDHGLAGLGREHPARADS